MKSDLKTLLFSSTGARFAVARRAADCSLEQVNTVESMLHTV